MLERLSVKKPYTVIVGIILVILLGIIAFTRMTMDLLPSMNFPYVIVYTPYVGATPEQVESEITRPMEASFATLTDIKNITSQSRDNVGLVVLQFNDTANMDTAMIEINSEITTLQASWNDSIGAPSIMKINPDMLPVTIMSVSREDMDIVELSDYVKEEIIPKYEAINGVASATASGLVTEEVDIHIEQSRIDVLNYAIIREIDENLAEISDQMDEGQAALEDGRGELARQKSIIIGKIDSGINQLERSSGMIDNALSELKAKRSALNQQLAQLDSAIEQMDAMLEIPEEDLNVLREVMAELGELEGRRQELLDELTALNSGEGSELIERARSDAEARLSELTSERSSLQIYLEELENADRDSLIDSINSLDTQIAAAEEELSTAKLDLASAEEGLNETNEQIERIRLLIREKQSDQQSESNETENTSEPLDASDTPKPENTGGENGSVDSGSTSTNGPDPYSSELPELEPEETLSPQAASDSDTETTSAATDPKDRETIAPTTAPSGQTSTSEYAAIEPTSMPASEDSMSEYDVIEPTPAAASEHSTSEYDVIEPTPVPISEENASDNGVIEQTSVPASEEDKAESGATEQMSLPSSERSGSEDKENEEEAERHSSEMDEAQAFSINSANAEELSLKELRDQLQELEDRQAVQQSEVTEAQAAVSSIESDLASLKKERDDKSDLLDQLDGSDTETRIEASKRRIEALDTRIAILEEEIAGLDQLLSGDGDALAAAEVLVAGLDEQIAAIKETDAYKAAMLLMDREELNAQYAAALEGRAQLEAGIKQIDSVIEKLENGIVPGGFIDGIDEDMNLKDARAMLRSARKQALEGFSEAEKQLDEAAKKLAEARKEFEDSRDEALENAGLDGIITVETVAGLIGAQNFSMPAGYVHDPEDTEHLVRVGDQFKSLDELRGMKLFSIGGEYVDEVRLQDVASVEITNDSEDTFTKVDGIDGILLSIEKQSTFSTTEVSNLVGQKSDELMAENDSLHVVDMFNQGEYINIVVNSVLENLIYGGILAILVLLVFLLDWRPTLIVALSIPLSVVITFVCMYFSGITLNVLSLSGLALGIGMLVDNSIVAIENIYRLRNEENMPLLHACVEGVRQVSGALFASTLTTICVFVPVLFVSGLAHDLFTDLGLTIAFSLLASLLVAMTVVPSMAASLLKRDRRKKENGLFTRLRSGYTKLLKTALNGKLLVLLASLGLLIYSVYQVPSMGISFMPEVNSTQMTATYILDPEEDVKAQQTRAMTVMEQMMQISGIESIGLTGGSGLRAVSGNNGSLTYYIIVSEKAERSNAEIAKDIRTVAEANDVALSVETSTMDISMLTGSGISVDIYGDDLDTMQEMARDIAEIAAQVEGTAEIDDGLEAAVPELRITIDKEKARDNNLTVAQVYQFIATKIAGKVSITDAAFDSKTLTIYLIDDRNSSISPESLEDLTIEVTTGNRSDLVRIGDIASIRNTQSLSTIHRSAQRRTHSVSFAVAEGYSANHVSDAFEARLAEYHVPEGYSVSLSGENETVLSIMDDMSFMLIIAVVMIFLIMVAQFQSFLSPIIVMFTIPLAFTGGLLALLLTGLDLSIVSVIGFLVLSGVIVNNGIVFVDTVNQLRISGMEKRDALIETGRLRMRPILMTSATTILGMLMIALGSGMGAEMMQPMAVVTIGGLAYATLMTLFVVPCLYDLFTGEKMKARILVLAEEEAELSEISEDREDPSESIECPPEAEPIDLNEADEINDRCEEPSLDAHDIDEAHVPDDETEPSSPSDETEDMSLLEDSIPKVTEEHSEMNDGDGPEARPTVTSADPPSIPAIPSVRSPMSSPARVRISHSGSRRRLEKRARVNRKLRR